VVGQPGPAAPRRRDRPHPRPVPCPGALIESLTPAEARRVLH
jgi:hypothetical protein